jgi:hypothetical protein
MRPSLSGFGISRGKIANFFYFTKEKALTNGQTQRRLRLVRAVQIFLLVLVFSGCAIAQEQEGPRFEWFVGYSLFNGAAQARHFFSGAQTNFKFNVNQRSAFVVDAAGEYRGDPSLMPNPDLFFLNFHDRYIHAYQLLVGPEFTRRKDSTDFFAHTLAGMVHSVGRTEGNNFVALGLGGGFVFHRQRKVGFRLQADYIPNRGAGHSYNDFRLGTGVVFRAK